MSNEQERLLILERVARGELSPQAGQLEIAMLKSRPTAEDVSGQDDLTGIIDAGQERFDTPAGASAFGESGIRPNMGPIMALLALPVLALGGFVACGLAFLLALPTYFAVALWNAQVSPYHLGWPVLGFWSSLAAAVTIVILWTLLGWGRRLRLAVRFGGGQSR